MINKLSNSSTVHNGHQFQGDSAATTSPQTPAHSPELDGSVEQSAAALLCLPSPVKDYAYAAFCPFTAGQYTEF
jgi:hypothetical protein